MVKREVKFRVLSRVGKVRIMGDNMRMEIVPIFQKAAKLFVRKFHRHHAPSRGAIFCTAVNADGKLIGVAMVGRPVARKLQDGLTAEVTRLCTDGTKNACSMLYSASWRIARELGYKRLITYIGGRCRRWILACAESSPTGQAPDPR